MDVVVIGDDPLRVQTLVHGLDAQGLSVLGIDATADPADDVVAAAAALVDLPDAVGAVDRLGAAVGRVVQLHEQGRARLVRSDDVELVGADCALPELADYLRDRSRRPSCSVVVDDRPTDRLDALTTRERDVLRQLLTGDDNATIGERLGISEHTVRTHVQNLMPKLGVGARADAAVLALELGLRPPETTS